MQVIYAATSTNLNKLRLIVSTSGPRSHQWRRTIHHDEWIRAQTNQKYNLHVPSGRRAVINNFRTIPCSVCIYDCIKFPSVKERRAVAAHQRAAPTVRPFVATTFFYSVGTALNYYERRSAPTRMTERCDFAIILFVTFDAAWSLLKFSIFDQIATFLAALAVCCFVVTCLPLHYLIFFSSSFLLFALLDFRVVVSVFSCCCFSHRWIFKWFIRCFSC